MRVIGALVCGMVLCLPLVSCRSIRREGSAVEAGKERRRPSIPLSAWVWDWYWASTSIADDFETYSRGLLALCEDRNIRTLYLGVDFPVPEERRGITAQLLERAHQRDIRVEASACDNRAYNGISLAHPGGEEGAHGYVSSVLTWNQSHATAQWFDGVHFDVEDYTGTWLDVLRRVWDSDALKQLKRMDPSFELGVVAVPAHWWGSEDRRQEWAYRLQDCTDYVAVMSYFLQDRTLSFFTGPSKPALDYAAKHGKKVYIGLEVSVWPGEGSNYPGWEYASFASRGEDELLHRIDRVNAALGTSPGFGGVVIQSSDAYQALYLTGREIEEARRVHGTADGAADPLSARIRPVEISGFATRKHHSAEDTAVKTSLAVFDLSPSVTPGQVLTFEAVFGEYSDIRPNPLTEEWVPAELIWFGFLEAESSYRFLRIDYSGSVGVRVSNDPLKSGVPGDWKDRLRLSYTRFTPQPGKAYEYRLYFFADSRVLLKIVDPLEGSVVWHSDRMPCHRDSLGRMYVEVLDKQPWGAVAFDAANRAIEVRKGDAVFARIRDLRCAPLAAGAE